MTSFERARVEGEELLKALGGSLEGGRRTRSSTRGTPATPPPPEKRARVSTPRRTKKAKEEAAEKVIRIYFISKANANKVLTLNKFSW